MIVTLGTISCLNTIEKCSEESGHLVTYKVYEFTLKSSEEIKLVLPAHMTFGKAVSVSVMHSKLTDKNTFEDCPYCIETPTLE